MKNQVKTLAIVAVIAAQIFSSCSVEKRVYMPGYHVQWKNNKHVINKQEELVKNNEAKPEEVIIEKVFAQDNNTTNENTITASASKSILVAKTQKNSFAKKSNHVVTVSNTVNNTGSIVVKTQAQKSTIAKKSSAKGSGKAGIGLYILALFIPFVAVGIYTGWKKPTLYNFLWTLLGFLPGIIHAFIVLKRGK